MAEELGEIADSLAPEDPLTPHLKELSGAVGKISHGFLKMEQDIRGDRKVHQAEINDGLADLMVYACDFANALEIDLSNVLRDTWATVRRRDWAAERRARAGQRAEPIIIDDLPAIAAPLADVLGSVDGDRCPACRHKIKRHEADDSELAAGCDRVDCSCTLDGLQIRLLYSLIRAASRHDNIVVSQILARGYDHEAGRA
jgi:NTP pyrophosphatase (non-canonical NTP hydrolase)